MKKRMLLRSILVLILCCAMVCNAMAAGVEDQEDDGVVKVTVTLNEGSETTNSASETKEYQSTDENGNEVQVVETTEREATVQTGDITVTENEGHGEIVSTDPTVSAEDYEGKQDIHDAAYPGAQDSDKDLFQGGGSYENQWKNAVSKDVIKEVVDEDGNTQWVLDPEKLEKYFTSEYIDGKTPEYALIAAGEWSDHQIVIKKVNYELDENGEVKLDEEGNPIYDLKKLGNQPVAHMLLWGTDGKPYYAYSVASSEEAFVSSLVSGYDAEQLSQSDLYKDNPEAQAHIRGIAQHGYWGSSNEAENGEYQVGSLNKLKEEMKAAVEAGLELSLNGNTDQAAILEAIENLTEGDAMSATQAALFAYAQGSEADIDGKLSMVIDGTFSGDKNYYANLVYQYLMGVTEKDDPELIGVDKESMNLVIGDRINEEDQADDVYDVALNFKLTLVPGEKDELKVVLQYTDADNNPQIITRTLGTENAGDTIAPDADGNYTLTGLKLSENQGITFDLKLEGTQYLENGVYVYTATNVDEDGNFGAPGSRFSTLIGVGDMGVKVSESTSVTLTFEVDENHDMKVTPVISEEIQEEPIPEKSTPSNQTEQTEPKAEETILDEETPLDEIFEEDVPMADVPHTGDASIYFAILSMLSGTGLAGLALTKKREEN